MTSIKVVAYSDELDRNGVPVSKTIYEGKCNYQCVTKRRWNKDKSEVTVNGICLIRDVFREFSSGYAEINGERRDIYSVSGVRNPDGSFNHMKIELK